MHGELNYNYVAWPEFGNFGVTLHVLRGRHYVHLFFCITVPRAAEQSWYTPGGVGVCCYNNLAPSTEMGHLAFRVGSLQQLAALKVNNREYGVWEVGS